MRKSIRPTEQRNQIIQRKRERAAAERRLERKDGNAAAQHAANARKITQNLGLPPIERRWEEVQDILLQLRSSIHSGQFKEAYQFLNECVTILLDKTRSSPPLHVVSREQRIHFLQSTAEIAALLDSMDIAEQLFKNALDLSKEEFGIKHSRTRELINSYKTFSKETHSTLPQARSPNREYTTHRAVSYPNKSHILSKRDLKSTDNSLKQNTGSSTLNKATAVVQPVDSSTNGSPNFENFNESDQLTARSEVNKIDSTSTLDIEPLMTVHGELRRQWRSREEPADFLVSGSSQYNSTISTSTNANMSTSISTVSENSSTLTSTINSHSKMQLTSPVASDESFTRMQNNRILPDIYHHMRVGSDDECYSNGITSLKYNDLEDALSHLHQAQNRICEQFPQVYDAQKMLIKDHSKMTNSLLSHTSDIDIGLGRAYMKLGQPRDAIIHFNRAFSTRFALFGPAATSKQTADALQFVNLVRAQSKMRRLPPTCDPKSLTAAEALIPLKTQPISKKHNKTHSPDDTKPIKDSDASRTSEMQNVTRPNILQMNQDIDNMNSPLVVQGSPKRAIDPRNWDADQVARWLKRCHLDSFSNIFLQAQISGDDLYGMFCMQDQVDEVEDNVADLILRDDLGISDRLDREQIRAAFLGQCRKTGIPVNEESNKQPFSDEKTIHTSTQHDNSIEQTSTSDSVPMYSTSHSKSPTIQDVAVQDASAANLNSDYDDKYRIALFQAFNVSSWQELEAKLDELAENGVSKTILAEFTQSFHGGDTIQYQGNTFLRDSLQVPNTASSAAAIITNSASGSDMNLGISTGTNGPSNNHSDVLTSMESSGTSVLVATVANDTAVTMSTTVGSSETTSVSNEPLSIQSSNGSTTDRVIDGSTTSRVIDGSTTDSMTSSTTGNTPSSMTSNTPSSMTSSMIGSTTSWTDIEQHLGGLLTQVNETISHEQFTSEGTSNLFSSSQEKGKHSAVTSNNVISGSNRIMDMDGRTGSYPNRLNLTTESVVDGKDTAPPPLRSPHGGLSLNRPTSAVPSAIIAETESHSRNFVTTNNLPRLVNTPISVSTSRTLKGLVASPKRIDGIQQFSVQQDLPILPGRSPSSNALSTSWNKNMIHGHRQVQNFTGISPNLIGSPAISMASPAYRHKIVRLSAYELWELARSRIFLVGLLSRTLYRERQLSRQHVKLFTFAYMHRIMREHRLRHRAIKVAALGIFSYECRMRSIRRRASIIFALGAPMMELRHELRHREKTKLKALKRARDKAAKTKSDGPKLRALHWELLDDVNGTIWEDPASLLPGSKQFPQHSRRSSITRRPTDGNTETSVHRRRRSTIEGASAAQLARLLGLEDHVAKYIVQASGKSGNAFTESTTDELTDFEHIIGESSAKRKIVSQLFPDLLDQFSAAKAAAAAKARKEAQAKAAGTSTRKKGSKMADLFDTKTSQNLNIALAKIKIPFPNIAAAIEAADITALGGVDTLQILTRLDAYNQEKIDTVRDWISKEMDEERDHATSNNVDLRSIEDKVVSRLGTAERFVWQVVCQVSHLEKKLSILDFMCRYEEMFSAHTFNLRVVRRACEEIKNSVKFATLLRDVILPLGNQLNAGSRKGVAIGFKISTLKGLTQTRANNKLTLLEYILDRLDCRNSELVTMPDDFKHLEPASKLSLSTLEGDIGRLSNYMRDVGAFAEVLIEEKRIELGISQEESAKLFPRNARSGSIAARSRGASIQQTPVATSTDSPPKHRRRTSVIALKPPRTFLRAIQDFEREHDAEVCTIQLDLRMVKRLFQETCVYLGEKGVKLSTEDLFGMLLDFLRVFRDSLQKVRAVRERAAREAARKATQKARNLGIKNSRLKSPDKSSSTRGHHQDSTQMKRVHSVDAMRRRHKGFSIQHALDQVDDHEEKGDETESDDQQIKRSTRRFAHESDQTAEIVSTYQHETNKDDIDEANISAGLALLGPRRRLRPTQSQQTMVKSLSTSDASALTTNVTQQQQSITQMNNVMDAPKTNDASNQIFAQHSIHTTTTIDTVATIMESMTPQQPSLVTINETTPERHVSFSNSSDQIEGLQQQQERQQEALLPLQEEMKQAKQLEQQHQEQAETTEEAGTDQAEELEEEKNQSQQTMTPNSGNNNVRFQDTRSGHSNDQIQSNLNEQTHGSYAGTNHALEDASKRPRAITTDPDIPRIESNGSPIENQTFSNRSSPLSFGSATSTTRRSISTYNTPRSVQVRVRTVSSDHTSLSSEMNQITEVRRVVVRPPPNPPNQH